MSNDLPANALPTQDDRIMAALAHISIVVPFMGLIAPIVIWATQKSKSPYIRFQALQATAYQLTMLLAGFAGMLCYMVSFVGIFIFSMLGSLAASGKDSALAPIGFVLFSLGFFLPFLILGALLIGMLIFIAYGIWAAIRTLQGRAFRYVILGRRVEAYLQSEAARPAAP